MTKVKPYVTVEYTVVKVIITFTLCNRPLVIFKTTVYTNQIDVFMCNISNTRTIFKTGRIEVFKELS